MFERCASSGLRKIGPMPAASKTRALPRSNLVLVCLTAALLAACGGGDTADSAPTGSGASPATPTPAPTPSPTPNPGVLSTCGIGDFDAQILAWINQMRAAGASCGGQTYQAAGALTWSAHLTEAADGHSRDMVALNYFSHTSADGRTLEHRISATGYAWSTIGENIAAGQITINEVMGGWRDSSGHCVNMMNANFTQIGVACVPGTANNTYRRYWTMNLARPR